MATSYRITDDRNLRKPEGMLRVHSLGTAGGVHIEWGEQLS